MRRLSHEQEAQQVSPAVRARAVRMLLEHRGEYPSLRTAVESIALKIGGVPQTLLGWVQRHEVYVGARAGVTASETQGKSSSTA